MHTLETVVMLIGEKTSKCKGCEGCLVEGCGDCPKIGGPGQKQLCCVNSVVLVNYNFN